MDNLKEITKCPKCNHGITEKDDVVIICRPCWEAMQFKTEVYSRVVGYIRPVEQWNKGKQEEFKDRKPFKTNQ
jgi:ribonucleoside-triphosphate reductase